MQNFQLLLSSPEKVRSCTTRIAPFDKAKYSFDGGDYLRRLKKENLQHKLYDAGTVCRSPRGAKFCEGE